MYILILGHTQELNNSPDDVGVIALYDRLVKENKGIVLMFPSGSILNEAKNLSKMESSYTENKVLFAHTERNIKDFIDQYKPKDLRLVGFSWGAGVIRRLQKDQWWRNDVPVKRTGYIDAVNSGKRNLATACRARPYFGNSCHLQIYQREDGVHPLRIQGNYPTKTKYNKWGIPVGWERDFYEGDLHWRVQKAKHNTIFELTEVQKETFGYITKD